MNTRSATALVTGANRDLGLARSLYAQWRTDHKDVERQLAADRLTESSR
jgi:hypothetical protein